VNLKLENLIGASLRFKKNQLRWYAKRQFHNRKDEKTKDFTYLGFFLERSGETILVILG
jgi:hypothetical protein